MGKFSLTVNEKCFILYICPRDRIPVSQIHFVPIFPRQWKWRQKCPEKKIFLISQVEAKMSRRNIFLISQVEAKITFINKQRSFLGIRCGNKYNVGNKKHEFKYECILDLHNLSRVSGARFAASQLLRV